MTPGDGAPDYDRGYLRVPLSVWSALYCEAPLTRRQLQLVSVVLRESWGWQTKAGQVYLWTRPLSPRQFNAATGLATDHLSRDLRALVARGILREQARRYQLVPDPMLWKTRGSPPQKRRSEGAKTAVPTAKLALSPSVLKKANKEERNVAGLLKSELSPTGDNFPPQAAPSPPNPGTLSPTVISGREAGSADRLAPLIESFVGPLPPVEAGKLRAWIAAVGVVRVWDALEPFLRLGRRVTRQQLYTLLAEQARRQDEEAAAPPGEAHHA